MYIPFTANLKINNNFKQYIYSAIFCNIENDHKSKNNMLCNFINNAISYKKRNIKNS